MIGVIPQPGLKGRWKVKAPFSLTAGKLYTLSAVRFFIDLENHGDNIFEVYYGPMSIDKATFTKDKRDGAVMLTLTTDDEGPRYIPSSFIESYPSLDSVQYHHVVLSASIGAIPVTTSLDFLETQVANVISDTIGVTPVINWGVMPLLSVVSPVQHQANEAKREAKIKNRTSDYARLLEEQQKNALLAQRLAVAEKIIKDLKDKGII